MNIGQQRSATPVLLVGLVSFGVFALISWNVQYPTLLTDLDERIALALYDIKMALPNVTAFIGVVTDLGNRSVLIGLVAVTGLVVLWLWPRRWIIPLTWLVVLIGGHWLMHSLKAVFQRPRPLDARTWTSWSFPSGHCSDAMINYGMLAYLLVLVLPDRRARIGVVVGMASVVLLVGFSRMYLTVHYFSDVLAGFALGAGWLFAWIAAIETFRHRQGGNGV